MGRIQVSVRADRVDAEPKKEKRLGLKIRATSPVKAASDEGAGIPAADLSG